MRRLYLTRALLAGVAATLAGGIVLRLTYAWPFHPLILAAGVVAALLFALLWDQLPPGAHPVVKAIIYCALLFGLLRPPLGTLPAAVAYALVLGVAYRPHPTGPRRIGLLHDPPVR